MAEVTEQISALLQEAAETHHRVYRIVDGADDDWASWYAWWLINLSEDCRPCSVSSRSAVT